MSLDLENSCTKSRELARYLGTKEGKRVRATENCLTLSPFFEWKKQEFNDKTHSWRSDGTTVTCVGVQKSSRRDRQMPK